MTSDNDAGGSVADLLLSSQAVVGRVDVDRLVCAVEDGNDDDATTKVLPPKMIYVVPSHHNPTGRSMTVE